MANPGTRTDALPAFHFEVDIGGTSYPFRSCTGLSSETKVYEVEEGGVNGYVHKLVGTTSFPNLVLRQGFCNPSSPLYALYQSFASSETGKKRFDGFVRQIGPNGTSAKWQFKQGWITKWSGPELDATKNEVSIESIEIVHEGLQLVGGAAGALGSAAGAGTTASATGTTTGKTAGATGTTAGATGTTAGATGTTAGATGTTAGATGTTAAATSAAGSSKSSGITSGFSAVVLPGSSKAATPSTAPAASPSASASKSASPTLLAGEPGSDPSGTSEA